ncbi:MAG: regulatory iron-sulfur-containing complex subunit RicT [Bacilli bacterium]|nr:regulatory iron-sulfur-containing complex subunit RicT [Bacilli bacterium]
MKKIVGVRFPESQRIYFYHQNNIEVKKGEAVIVETERGLQFGNVLGSQPEMKNIRSQRKIIRKATSKDIEDYKRNKIEAEQAQAVCKRFIKKRGLEMKLLSSNFTLDRKQLFFYFYADNRVDFRELAKDLAQVYKTRIELRQIGVRDKAKECGGIGPCGREICCAKFLTDFNAISINMAKNQNLSLNPNKINGVCGRLLCCLNYEENCHKNCHNKSKKREED